MRDCITEVKGVVIIAKLMAGFAGLIVSSILGAVAGMVIGWALEELASELGETYIRKLEEKAKQTSQSAKQAHAKPRPARKQKNKPAAHNKVKSSPESRQLHLLRLVFKALGSSIACK